MFIDRLIKNIKKTNNPTVVGLDTKLNHIPMTLREQSFSEYGENTTGISDAILQFNKRLIDAIYDIVPAVKPQMAYYEMYGAEGIHSFAETCAYARSKGMIVIADGKRNDIGTTAQAYSDAYLGELQVGDIKQSMFEIDALTVNPYLGYDGIKPFAEACAEYDKGIFILVKTSNKSSGQLQDLITNDGKHIYEKVAELVNEWGSSLIGEHGYSSIGAVVGATWPEQAKVLRKVMNKAYILVPGYGAQGGTAMDAVQSFNSDGLGAIINASRSILCAWKSEQWSGKYNEDDFDIAAREEAIRMRNDINKALESK